MSLATRRLLDTVPARQLERWERVGLGIRLAYNAQAASVIRFWLALGTRLAGGDAQLEAALLQRSLRLLVHTARDPALPWFWRSVCLEHTPRPLARLRSLGITDDPHAPAWQRAVDDAHQALGCRP
jgi:hypothetical protein